MSVFEVTPHMVGVTDCRTYGSSQTITQSLYNLPTWSGNIIQTQDFCGQDRSSIVISKIPSRTSFITYSAYFPLKHNSIGLAKPLLYCFYVMMLQYDAIRLTFVAFSLSMGSVWNAIYLCLLKAFIVPNFTSSSAFVFSLQEDLVGVHLCELLNEVFNLAEIVNQGFFLCLIVAYYLIHNKLGFTIESHLVLLLKLCILRCCFFF